MGFRHWGLCVVIVSASVAWGQQTPPPAAGADSLRVGTGVGNPANIDQWRSSEQRGSLKPYPKASAGAQNPAGGMSQFGGSALSSFSSPDLGMPFSAFKEKMEWQRPAVDAASQAALSARYALDCRTDAAAKMTRGKPLPTGPTGRLPQGVRGWDDYAAMSADEIRSKGGFPYRPLDHPLQSTGHMVFPRQWTRVHPEHERFDAGFDIPDCYLPEYPPPLYLTTHPEMGDVTRGVELSVANYFEMLNGTLTPAQMEGLRSLVTPFPTAWFNTTHHRVTPQPTLGVACFSCHVNGHTNGAMTLAPDSRPNYARLRVDTPTLRGHYANALMGSKRASRSMVQYVAAAEYFDGDPSLQAMIAGPVPSHEQAQAIGEFAAIIDFPPAPKLGPSNRLLADKASEQELRGEALFNGKAQCSSCHPAATHFTDNTAHDLKVERFYEGRAEGPIKTFSLRGVKDSPPYLHDGRLLTLEDTVEFFNLVLGTRLTPDERQDLVAYLRCL